MEEPVAGIEVTAREELRTLARFPDLHAIGPAAPTPSTGKKRRSPTPPNTRILTLTIVGVLLAVCVAWVVWPTGSTDRLMDDVSDAQFRVSSPAHPLVPLAQAKTSSGPPPTLLAPQVDEPAPAPAGQAGSKATLLGYIVEPVKR